MPLPQRILVVDDDADNALVIRMILECNGFQVDMFTDPKLALSSFEPQKYALAIIDLRMNGMDGFELYERIFEMDHHKRICFMSCYDYVNALSRFQNKHCEISPECFLRKPLSVEAFIATIKRLTIENRQSSARREDMQQNL
ncbi:MAG: response regulator [Nitrososphaera sp.]|jgi:CheY-like chemotaxis protein